MAALKFFGGFLLFAVVAFVIMPAVVLSNSLMPVKLNFWDRGTPHELVRILTASNLDAGTRLTSADRKAAVASCLVQFNAQKRPGATDARNREIRRELLDYAEGACDCAVNSLEDTLTTLQFTYAMSANFVIAPNLDTADFSMGDTDNFTAVRSVAEKLGAADGILRRADVQALNGLMDVRRKCTQRN